MSLSRQQANFVDKLILNPKVKKAISSKYEYEFKKVLRVFGEENVDWFHQKAYYNEEERLVAVPDFVFPKRGLMIELDGSSHNRKKQRQIDIKRDKVFSSNGFHLLRIPTPIPNEKLAYWKVYIEETLKICDEKVKKQQSKKKTKKMFTDKEFENEFRRRMAL